MLPLAIAFRGAGKPGGREAAPGTPQEPRWEPPGHASTSFPGMPGAPGGGRRRLPGQGRLEPGRGAPGPAGRAAPAGEFLASRRPEPPAAAPRAPYQPGTAAPAAAHGAGRWAGGCPQGPGWACREETGIGNGVESSSYKTLKPPSPPAHLPELLRGPARCAGAVWAPRRA